jgi:hypothetical protein
MIARPTLRKFQWMNICDLTGDRYALQETEFTLLFLSCGCIGRCVGMAFFAYRTGEHFQAMPGPSPSQMLSIVTAGSTSTVASVGLVLSPMTFAKAEPAPPVIPPGDRQQQG